MNESDFRKISIAAIVLLVVVRLSIGWQMLYEGLWKLQQEKTAQPWTSEPYLKNAQGPLRNYFRSLSGDPNDLMHLDYDVIEARWTNWGEKFTQHYALTPTQTQTLNNLLHGPAEFSRALPELPAGVDLKKRDGRGLYYNEQTKRLVVDGKLHMTPREKQDALRQVNFTEGTDKVADITDPVKKKYVEEIQRIYTQQSRLSFKEQALATLKGDPQWAGQIDAAQRGTNDEKRLGKIEIYQNRLKRYEENLASRKLAFDQKHLDYDWKEIQQLRAELVGPIKRLESDMKWQAEKLLTTDQLAKGALPREKSPVRDIDLKTMWGLTILGTLLMAGLCTRVAALGGAFLILQFYLAYPPLPGYPMPPGPEHSLFVNKNLIEVLTLLAFVFLPSGRWFGIDALFSGLFTKKEPNDRR